MTEFIMVFVLSYLWHGMGVTVGYHRLLSHRSFRCAKLVEYFFVLGGYLALEGSPIWWCVSHRLHHRYVDTKLDPHSPRFGIKMAYNGWTRTLKYPAMADVATQCKDLLKDPLYKFLERNGDIRNQYILAFSFNIFFRLWLWAIFGWQVALASFAAGMLFHKVPLILNVVCHIPKLGYKNFQTGDDSVNVWWMGILALGEGWHNNHHAFPGSARSGLRPHEVDLSWLTLRALKLVGLVTWMNEAPANSVKPQFQFHPPKELLALAEEFLPEVPSPKELLAAAEELLPEARRPAQAVAQLRR